MAEDPYSADPSRPRGGPIRRWLGRVMRTLIDEPLHDTRTPIPSHQGTGTVKRVEEFTFETPSKGDAYDFTVAVELCLCATGQHSDAVLNSTINERLADLRAEVRAAARPEARKYPPYRPGMAEPHVTERIQAAVNLALAGVPDEQGVSLQCGAKVRVDMPEPVRQLQRLTMQDQIKLEARYEHSEQAAQRLGELREIWSRFIEDGLDKWNTPYAVNMAQQPAQTANILFKLRADRMNEAAKLVDTVSAVAGGSDRMDLLEFQLATDRALSRAYELLGIAPPPPDEGSVFDGEASEAAR